MINNIYNNSYNKYKINYNKINYNKIVNNNNIIVHKCGGLKHGYLSFF